MQCILIILTLLLPLTPPRPTSTLLPSQNLCSLSLSPSL